MKIGGRLIAPVLTPADGTQALHLVDRPGRDDWTLTVLDAVRFVPLRRGTN
jgi:protein-L-isoaspartate O-methyltransferase